MVFAGIFVLVALIDYIEMMRRSCDISECVGSPVARLVLPRTQVTERIMPFLRADRRESCYLNLSRRLELVVARAAGNVGLAIRVAGFGGSFLIGVSPPATPSTILYRPSSRAVQALRSRTVQPDPVGLGAPPPIMVNQRSSDGQAIIGAKSSRDQGVSLSGVTVLPSDAAGNFKQRIDARARRWNRGSGNYSMRESTNLACCRPTMPVPTQDSLTPEQVRESFATPETVPFWELPSYIEIAEHAGLGAAGYRLQFQKLLPGRFADRHGFSLPPP